MSENAVVEWGSFSCFKLVVDKQAYKCINVSFINTKREESSIGAEVCNLLPS